MFKGDECELRSANGMGAIQLFGQASNSDLGAPGTFNLLCAQS